MMFGRRKRSEPLLLPQMAVVIELLSGVATILMTIDEQLDRVVELLEEDA